MPMRCCGGYLEEITKQVEYCSDASNSSFRAHIELTFCPRCGEIYRVEEI